MRFASANYFRYIAHAARSKKAADRYLKSLSPSEIILMNNPKQLQEIYDSITEASQNGKASVSFPHTHLLWQTPSVQTYLKEKGFEVLSESKTVKWWGVTKELK